MAERNSCDECVGAFLTQNGITSAMLSYDSAELSPIEVTNSVALDLYHFQSTFHSFRRWMAILIGYKWPVNKFPLIQLRLDEVSFAYLAD